MKVYQLNVRILNIEPSIWRRVEMPANYQLSDLHEILQIVMGWEHKHGYTFSSPERVWLPGKALSSARSDGRKYSSSSSADLGGVLRKTGDTILYTYDEHDLWVHEIRLEKVFNEDGDAHPICRDGERHCPPEGCGGPEAYMELLAALSMKGTPEYRKAAASLDEDFDPEYFDIDSANEVFRQAAEMELEEDWEDDIIEEALWEKGHWKDDVFDDDDWDDDDL